MALKAEKSNSRQMRLLGDSYCFISGQSEIEGETGIVPEEEKMGAGSSFSWEIIHQSFVSLSAATKTLATRPFQQTLLHAGCKGALGAL